MSVTLSTKLKGKRVAVVVSDTNYEGLVTNVSDVHIILLKPFSSTLNKAFPKPLTFAASDVQSIDVIDSGAGVCSPTDNNVSGKAIVKPKSSPLHLHKLKNDIDLNTLLNRAPPPPKETESQAEVHVPAYVVIDSINEDFRNATGAAMLEAVIGFAMLGVRLGREGVVCWIAIAAGEKVFLFDMCSLGPPGILHGLGDLLTHESIVKVVHDCRFVADALLHKYGVQLVNVFDTQVADAVLIKRAQGCYSRHVNSLANCLQTHLLLPNEAVFFHRIRSSYGELDEQMWTERPLPPHLQRAAVLQVCYLSRLRIVLMEKLLWEVTSGTEIYLKEVSSLPDATASFKHDSAHLLPVRFSELSINSGTGRKKAEDAPRKFPQNECDPYLRFSRDMLHRTNNNSSS